MAILSYKLIGNLLSIDLESGKKLWSKSTEDVVSSGLDVNFKTISYGTLDGHLVTLDQHIRRNMEISNFKRSLSPQYILEAILFYKLSMAELPALMLRLVNKTGSMKQLYLL